MFGQFFFISQKLFFQFFVFRFTGSSWTGSSQRKGTENPVFQLYQCFWGSACDLQIRTGEIEHIRRWIQGAENSVGLKQAALKGSTEAVGKYNLKNVSFMDSLLCFFNHIAEGILVKHGGNISKKFSRKILFFFTIFQKLCQMFQLQNSLVVADLRISKGNIDHKDNFLPDMVKGNYFIKEHQIQILEGIVCSVVAADRRLAVSKIVIGKISYQSSCKRRKIIKTRTFVFTKYLAKNGRWLICVNRKVSSF